MASLDLLHMHLAGTYSYCYYYHYHYHDCCKYYVVILVGSVLELGSSEGALHLSQAGGGVHDNGDLAAV